MRALFLTIVVTVAAIILCACSPAPSSAPITSTPAASPPPAVTSIPADSASSGSSQTFGQLADLGKNVYSTNCSSCHGSSGQGGRAPAVIGSGAKLSKYNTAGSLLSFISLSMPAYSPGSLNRPDYLNVMAYLLVQNNYVPAAAVFNENQLSTISLK